MPIVGDPNTPVPNPAALPATDPGTPVVQSGDAGVPAPTATPTPLADEWYLQPNVADNEAAQRAAAAELGSNYDDLNELERQLVATYAAERAKSLSTIAPVTSDPTAPTSGATTDDAAADGVRTGDEASSGSDGVAPVTPGILAPDAPIPPIAPVPPVVPTPPVPPIAPVPSVVPTPAPAAPDPSAILTPQEIEIINALRRGETPTALAPQAPPPLIPADLELEDPNVRKALEGAFGPVQQQIAQLQEQQRAVLQIQETQMRASLNAALDSGANEFRTAHPELDDAGFTALVGQVGASSLLQSLEPQYPGNPHGLAKAALDFAYWANPDTREADFQRRLAEHNTTSLTAREKIANQAPIAATQGSIPTPTQKTAPASSPEGIKQMADFIAQAQNGNGAQPEDALI